MSGTAGRPLRRSLLSVKQPPTSRCARWPERQQATARVAEFATHAKEEPAACLSTARKARRATLYGERTGANDGATTTCLRMARGLAKQPKYMLGSQIACLWMLRGPARQPKAGSGNILEPYSTPRRMSGKINRKTLYLKGDVREL